MRITKSKRGIAIAAASLAALSTGGAAVAATQTDSPAASSKTIVASAAKQVGVSESALTAALIKSEETQIDAQVTAGRLTQAEADEIKQRLESGDVPLVGIGMGFGDHHDGPGHGGPGHDLAAASTYLGVSEATIRSDLDGGKTLAQIATANSKTVDGLVTALVAAEKSELDAAVTSGKITQTQEAAMLVNSKQHITDEVNGKRPSGPFPGFERTDGAGDGPTAPAPDATLTPVA